jgi:DNA-binding Lrp family transcriptional regulator
MNKQDTLKPVDLVVALALAIAPEGTGSTFSQLGQIVGVSSSTAFEAVQRLQRAGLLRPGTRDPNRHALRNFLEYGVRHAFPPSLGPEARGVATAYSGPELSAQFDIAKPIVWPDRGRSVHGTALTPLFPQATSLPERAPDLYNALTLVDALRVGRARERTAAMEALDRLLKANPEAPNG